MSHQEYREMLLLFLYEELSEDQNTLLKSHLEVCPDCRSELQALKKLHTVFAKRRSEPSDQLLQDARQQLRAALRIERSRPTLGDRVRDWFPVFRYALAAAAVLAIGIFLGRVVFVPRAPIEQVGKGTTLQPNALIDRGNPGFTNIHFLDADAGDGRVEFTFDMVTPVKVNGDVSNPEVQKVLSYAILNDQNPGIRLRAVNTLSENEKADPKLKAALIQVIKSDQNDGVRKEALLLLQKYPVDDQMKDAFLYVLQHDANPMLRIEAIKSLQPKNEDKEVQTVLKEKMESDENSYIRDKAKRLLQQANQKL